MILLHSDIGRAPEVQLLSLVRSRGILEEALR